MYENLLANCKFVVCSGAAAAGVTTLDGAVIDMAQDDGYDGIAVIAKLGDVTATSVPNVRLMGSDASDGSAPIIENDLANIAAAGASDQDNKLLVLDTRGPASRYVFSRVLRTTANAVVESVLAILYNPRRRPVVQGADVFAAVYDWVISS